MELQKLLEVRQRIKRNKERPKSATIEPKKVRRSGSVKPISEKLHRSRSSPDTFSKFMAALKKEPSHLEVIQEITTPPEGGDDKTLQQFDNIFAETEATDSFEIPKSYVPKTLDYYEPTICSDSTIIDSHEGSIGTSSSAGSSTSNLQTESKSIAITWEVLRDIARGRIGFDEKGYLQSKTECSEGLRIEDLVEKTGEESKLEPQAIEAVEVIEPAQPIEPTEDNYTPEPTNVEYAIEPTTFDYPIEPTKVEYAIESTEVGYNIQPTAYDYTIEPNKVEYALEPTEVVYNMEPAPFEYIEPTQVQYNNQPPAYEYALQPPQVQYNMQPTAYEYTMQPPAVEYNIQPTAYQYPTEPNKVEYNLQPTEVDYTIVPTPFEYTIEPTKLEYAVEPTEIEYDFEPTHVEYTVDYTDDETIKVKETVIIQTKGK